MPTQVEGMEFKDKLKQAMKEHGWSQTSVAEQVQKSKATVSQWLSGKQTPSEASRRDIAVSLGLSPDYFQDGDPGTGFQRLTIEQTARILGVGKDTVRLGLQQGVFPWGYAVQTSTGWTYIINGSRLAQVEGVKI